jgi:hypothetical protein
LNPFAGVEFNRRSATGIRFALPPRLESRSYNRRVAPRPHKNWDAPSHTQLDVGCSIIGMSTFPIHDSAIYGEKNFKTNQFYGCLIKHALSARVHLD